MTPEETRQFIHKLNKESRDIISPPRQKITPKSRKGEALDQESKLHKRQEAIHRHESGGG